MGVTFKAALIEYRWLSAAYQRMNTMLDSGKSLDEKGWGLYWQHMDRFDAVEASARRAGATGCIHGSGCPADGPVNCLHCAGMLEVEAAA